MFMNECIDITMDHNPRMLAVLLDSEDPRTSWSFQLVRRVGISLEHSQVERSPLIACAWPIGSSIRAAAVPTGG
jgi:hypothetical protein